MQCNTIQWSETGPLSPFGQLPAYLLQMVEHVRVSTLQLISYFVCYIETVVFASTL